MTPGKLDEADLEIRDTADVEVGGAAKLFDEAHWDGKNSGCWLPAGREAFTKRSQSQATDDISIHRFTEKLSIPQAIRLTWHG